ncbi:MAG: hypothetical protein WC532_00220 [Candidatus Omnitrophota bacterium]
MGALIPLIFLLIIAGFYSFIALIWWKIFKKTGFHPALGILMLVPFLNLVMLAFLAFREWPVREKLSHYSASGVIPQKSLAMPLIVAIVFAAVIPVTLLFIAIAVPNFMRAKLIANEAMAQAVVKNVSQAVEDYASANNGVYPTNEVTLKYPVGSEVSYDDKTIEGYSYSVNLRQDGYEVAASPEKCGVTGFNVFLAETGGKLAAKDCR